MFHIMPILYIYSNNMVVELCTLKFLTFCKYYKCIELYVKSNVY